ncbi:MAG: hypothetical protein ACFFBD_05975 [Candidatus Hodarchaeota archaeon]
MPYLNILKNALYCEAGENLLILTDTKRKALAEKFATAAQIIGCCTRTLVLPIKKGNGIPDFIMNLLDEQDILLTLFSFEGSQVLQTEKFFPSFQRPKGFNGRSASVNRRIKQKTLEEMFQVDYSHIEEFVDSFLDTHQNVPYLQIITKAGTDLIVKPRKFKVLPFIVTPDSNHAYLPASEIFTSLTENFSYGQIVIDLTIGEFVVKGEKREKFGLVSRPITLDVEKGKIKSISGEGPEAEKLITLLDEVGDSSKVVAELGIGLNSGTEACGFIAVDECLMNTAHFGFGRNIEYGGTNESPIHLDCVFKSPKFTVLKDIP